MNVQFSVSLESSRDEQDMVINSILRVFGRPPIDDMSHTIQTTNGYTVQGVGQPGNVIAYADMPQIGGTHPGQSAPHVQPERATNHPNHQVAAANGFQVPPPAGYVEPSNPMPDAVVTPAAQNAMNQANTTQLDKSGCPWDGRIHATPPSINKGDEMWRSKKGVDKAQAEALSTELRRIASAGGNTLQAAPAGMPQANQAQFTPAPAPVQQQAAPVSTAFTEMMAQLAPHVASGAIPQATIDEAARRVGAHNNGVGNVTLLQHNEALIPAFVAQVNAICAGQ